MKSNEIINKLISLLYIMLNTTYILQHSFSIDYNKAIEEGYDLYLALSLMLFDIDNKKESTNSTEIDNLYKEMMLVYMNIKYQILLYISLLSISQSIQTKMIKLMVRYNNRLNKKSSDELFHLYRQLNEKRIVKNRLYLKGGGPKTRKKRKNNTKRRKGKGKRGGMKNSSETTQSNSKSSKTYKRPSSSYKLEMIYYFKIFLIIWLRLSYFFMPIPIKGQEVPSMNETSSSYFSISMSPYFDTTSNESYYTYFSKMLFSDVEEKEKELSAMVNKTLLENQTKMVDMMNLTNETNAFLEDVSLRNVTREDILIARNLLQEQSNATTMMIQEEEEEEEVLVGLAENYFTSEYEKPIQVPSIIAAAEQKVEPMMQDVDILHYQPKMRKKKEEEQNILSWGLSLLSSSTNEEVVMDNEELLKKEWATTIKDTNDLLENRFIQAQQSCISIANLARDYKLFKKEAATLIEEPKENETATTSSITDLLPSVFTTTSSKPTKKNTTTSVSDIKGVLSNITKEGSPSFLVASQNETHLLRTRFEQGRIEEHLSYCRDFVKAPSNLLSIESIPSESQAATGLVPVGENDTIGAGIFFQRKIHLTKSYHMNVDVANFQTFILHLEMLQSKSEESIKRIVDVVSEKDAAYLGWNKFITDNMTPSMKIQVERYQDLNEKIELLIRFLQNFQSKKKHLLFHDSERYIKQIISQYNQSLTNDLNYVIEFQEQFEQFLPLETMQQNKQSEILQQKAETELKLEKVKSKIAEQQLLQRANTTRQIEEAREKSIEADDERIKNDRREGKQYIEKKTAYVSGIGTGIVKETINLALAPMIELFTLYWWLPLLVGIFGLGGITLIYGGVLNKILTLLGFPVTVIKKIYSFFRYKTPTPTNDPTTTTITDKKEDTNEGLLLEQDENHMSIIHSDVNEGRGKNSFNVIRRLIQDPNLKLMKLVQFYQDHKEFENVLLIMGETQTTKGGKEYFESICARFMGINEETNKIRISIPESTLEERIFEEDIYKVLDPIHNAPLYVNYDGDFTRKVIDCKEEFERKEMKRANKTKRIRQFSGVRAKSSKKKYTGESSSSEEENEPIVLKRETVPKRSTEGESSFIFPDVYSEKLSTLSNPLQMSDRLLSALDVQGRKVEEDVDRSMRRSLQRQNPSIQASLSREKPFVRIPPLPENEIVPPPPLEENL